MPVISIVVPIYNAQRFLPRCLDSLVNQTFRDIEILCVNDGSTDDSLAIVWRYAQSDERVLVIDQPNGGLSAARNVGMAHARGEYLLFIDADDWVELALCEQALHAIQAGQADVACWGYVREKGTVSVPVPLFEDGLRDAAACRALLREMVGLTGAELRHPEHMDRHVNVWNKLYRTALIRTYGLTFTDTRKVGAEDLFFNMQYFLPVGRAATLRAQLTHYNKGNPDSITATYNAQRPAQWKALFHEIGIFLEKNRLGEDFRQALTNKTALSIIWLGLELMRSRLPARTIARNLENLLRDEIYASALAALPTKEMGFVWRAFFGCARRGQTRLVFLLLRIMHRMNRNR